MGKTGEILKKNGIRPFKALGQNFLTDEKVAKGIIDSAEVESDELVVEIGPGTGSLTLKILERTQKLLAIEIDRRFIHLLKRQLEGHIDAKVINDDFLKISLEDEISRLYGNTIGKYKVLANLPYYITTPVIMKLLEQESKMELMVIMVQKEVGERILANPGTRDYGALSVAVRYYASPQKIMDVSPNCFIPRPSVYSSVIKLKRNASNPYEILDREIFFKTVKAAFGQRRKKLANALFNSGFFNLQKDEINKIMGILGLEANIRGEMLGFEQFVELSNQIGSCQ